MPLELDGDRAVLTAFVGIEEIDPLLAWLGTTPAPSMDLARCEHLHTAVLQALLAAGARVAASPADPFLASLLEMIDR